MFTATRLAFYAAVSPVHMGAGSAIGAIDSPIQREVHTQHPSFAGSGLKGALRHHFANQWPREGDKPNGLIARIFGPDTNASDYAGALSLTDAQLVALPVRSLRNGFAYVTSPLALARLRRLALQAGVECGWEVPTVPQAGQALLSGAGLADKDQLVLEAFEFRPAKVEPLLANIAQWIAKHALAGAGNQYFQQKFCEDLVLLHDTDFSHFARHGMVVEPHVRINDQTGTADGGGLFYVENLPPESLLVGLVQASDEHRAKPKAGEDGAAALPRLGALDILTAVLNGTTEQPGIHGKVLQIGGDATTGRGLVLVQCAPQEPNQPKA
ncbi:type III-B CRISPR module RAMP protein Cmr4 [Candidatus Symbiobacter mobilis]|uniref:CRISPR type III-associated protein domain-containing protein n=1 Tax=Candidatus Symbiobacter mobilis CR TaxID=946483 RepID=U5N6D1_9BURK|nr:type III-B CRISPR module RAMP protein Cmr4 [Candidatus Symbiobacter mobilis]AGX86922.1 hypothetical protein Cenrod_0816 [Candidatus Symbiobacter mobilis CR]